MKNLFHSSAAAVIAATLSIVSCSKAQVVEQQAQTEDEPRYKLEIKIANKQTKATDLLDEDESQINNIQIFLFDADNKIESYACADDESGLSDIYVTAGQKHIYAVTNMDQIDEIMTVSDLTGTISVLEDNGLDNLVMCGSTDVTIDDDKEISIDVYRLVSRIDLKKITTAFSSTALANLPFEVDSIYVINVVNECALSRKFIKDKEYSYLNKRGFQTSGADALLLDDDCEISFDGNDSQELTNSYYVYPNNSYSDVSTSEWCPRQTRLVIAAKLNGEKMYYPINIIVDEPNKKYIIEELIITRPGSDSPDQPVSLYECSFKLKVMSWASSESRTEEI